MVFILPYRRLGKQPYILADLLQLCVFLPEPVLGAVQSSSLWQANKKLSCLEESFKGQTDRITTPGLLDIPFFTRRVRSCRLRRFFAARFVRKLLSHKLFLFGITHGATGKQIAQQVYLHLRRRLFRVAPVDWRVVVSAVMKHAFVHFRFGSGWVALILFLPEWIVNAGNPRVKKLPRMEELCAMTIYLPYANAR